MKEKRVVGWKETLDLPDLGIYGLEAKIDTGAASSVLHCNTYQIVHQNGEDWISCNIITNFETDASSDLYLPVYKVKMVKNSFGQQEKRYYIRTTAKLYGELFEIKLSLRNRSEMNYPMLLGRSFLRRKFLVDVSKEDLSLKSSKK